MWIDDVVVLSGGYGSVGIEVYYSIFESNGYGIRDTSSNLTGLGSKFLRNGVR